MVVFSLKPGGEMMDGTGALSVTGSLSLVSLLFLALVVE